jgi:hypothetical protein
MTTVSTVSENFNHIHDILWRECVSLHGVVITALLEGNRLNSESVGYHPEMRTWVTRES